MLLFYKAPCDLCFIGVSDAYIILCDVGRETSQHYSVALFLMLRTVALAWIIPIIFIIRSVISEPFSASLLQTNDVKIK